MYGSRRWVAKGRCERLGNATYGFYYYWARLEMNFGSVSLKGLLEFDTC